MVTSPTGSGEEAFDRLWENKSKADAIFCVNDLVACGVVDAAPRRTSVFPRIFG
jgi:DNA-binding LacI/PurR family transcriptional regulator